MTFFSQKQRGCVGECVCVCFGVGLGVGVVWVCRHTRAWLWARALVHLGVGLAWARGACGAVGVCGRAVLSFFFQVFFRVISVVCVFSVFCVFLVFFNF